VVKAICHTYHNGKRSRCCQCAGEAFEVIAEDDAGDDAPGGRGDNSEDMLDLEGSDEE
jgi:hypothetical protein